MQLCEWTAASALTHARAYKNALAHSSLNISPYQFQHVSAQGLEIACKKHEATLVSPTYVKVAAVEYLLYWLSNLQSDFYNLMS